MKKDHDYSLFLAIIAIWMMIGAFAQCQSAINIDKVCEYLANHIDKGLVIYNDHTWLKRDEFIKKLKKEINK